MGLPLRHHYNVARLQQDIFLYSLENFLVVIRQPHLFSVFVPEIVNVFFPGKLRETTGTRKSLQNRHARKKLESTGMSYFAGDKDSSTVDLSNCDGHLRIINILGKTVADVYGKLHGRQTRGVHVV